VSEVHDFNKRVIEEFRANGGVVGGPMEGMPLLLLHTVGAKSGQPRVNPLAYLSDGDRLVVIASFAGAPNHPPWYHNLLANPDVVVEVGDEKLEAVATVAHEPERTELYAKMAAAMPIFDEYQARTDRVIPVVLLTRR
jgi:deazaflavin-dependent oxidoreductase (nitroreductase family)